MRTHPGRALTRDDFSAMFTPAYLQAATMHNAITGFRITGICPFDENVFPEECFAPSEVTSEAQPNQHIDKSGDTATHKDMDDQEDPDDPNTSQNPSENEEMDTTSGIDDEVWVTAVTDDSHQDTGGNMDLGTLSFNEHSQEKVTKTNESLAKENCAGKTDGNKSLKMFGDLMPLPRKTSTLKRKPKTTVARRLTSPENIKLVKQAEWLSKKKEQLKMTKLCAVKGKKKIGSQKSNNKAVVTKLVKGKKVPAVCKSQPVATLHGPSTSGVNNKTQTKKPLQEQSICGKCDGDFYDDEEGEPWIQCRGCGIWFHEICAGVYGKVKYDFICDECAG